MDIDTGDVNVVRVQLARLQYVVFYLYDGGFGGHGHDGIEAAPRHPELKITQFVRFPGPHEGVVGVQRKFQNVVTAVDFPVLFALGQLGSHAGGSVEPTDAGAGGPYALG